MKTLYLDCGMGAAGDMLTAALLELMPDREAAVAELNAVGVPNVVYGCETVTRCGIRGTHMSVQVNGVEESASMHDHHHHHEGHQHTGLHGIEHIVREHLHLPEQVRADVLAVYGLLAEAESHVHGVPVTEIHFQEVGTMDALADHCVAGLCRRRTGAVRPRHSAGACACHGVSAAGHPRLQRHHSGGAVYPYRRGAAEALRLPF